MTTFVFETCPKCDAAIRLAFGTRDGRLVETLVSGCEHARKKAGLCAMCPASIPTTGPRKYCLPCRVAKNREWARVSMAKTYALDPAKERERVRRYRALHPEKHRRSMAAYRARNPEKVKAMRQRAALRSHPGYEASLERGRAYYYENWDKIQARRAEKRAQRRAGRAA